MALMLKVVIKDRCFLQKWARAFSHRALSRIRAPSEPTNGIFQTLRPFFLLFVSVSSKCSFYKKNDSDIAMMMVEWLCGKRVNVFSEKLLIRIISVSDAHVGQG